MRQPDDKSWEEEHIFRLDKDIEILQDKLKWAYCEKVGSDSIVGLDSCDNYKDWLLTLNLAGEGVEDVKISQEII